ncbi:MAG: 3-dehydroquinate synthase [Legionellales bacterium]|nr:3-dehydroquinate synthase [Legionellales bacterium]
MNSLTLQTPQRQYPVYIGQGLLSETHLFTAHIHGQQLVMVSNETVAPLYLDFLKQQLRDYSGDTVILPDGEAHKTWSSVSRIMETLINQRHHRDTTLIALGGGVIGDMTGFAAACYQRGVNYIQIPTTLLAQVDAAIGGKTAINFHEHKNMLGAFHQPQAVICDITVLSSLPDRHLRSGFAEIIKAALIASPEFFQWLELNATLLLARDTDALTHAITRSCQIKIKLVEHDEREHAERALLNLGHTFAHGIEAAHRYRRYLHGEAVGLGIICAAKLAHRLGLLHREKHDRIHNIIKRYKLPTQLKSHKNPEEILQFMLMDKKILRQSLRYILPTDQQTCVIQENIPEIDVLTVLKEIMLGE